MSSIQELAKTQQTQFDYLKKAIKRVKKNNEKQNKQSSPSPVLTRNVDLEEKLIKVQSENVESFANLRETL